MPAIEINDETMVHVDEVGRHGLVTMRWEGDTIATLDTDARRELIEALGGRLEDET